MLALAWAFDLTREGLRRTEPASHARPRDAELDQPASHARPHGAELDQTGDLRKARREKDARAGLARLRRRARATYVSPYHLAIALLGVGRQEEAVAELERAAAERSPQLVALTTEPLLAPLRERPAFRRLVARTGLPIGGAGPGRTAGRPPPGAPLEGAR